MATTVELATPVAATPEALFAWHARPGAFERLTPPWEHATVVARSGPLAEGTRVTLRVAMGPVGLTWEALHRDVAPGRGFTDEQVRGPFASWVHRHAFEPAADGAVVRDRIEFVPPGGPLGALAAPFVRRKLERMLRWRHATLAADLAAHARFPARPLSIVVTGATGMIGSVLVPFLATGGHQVTRLVRRPGPGDAGWDPARRQVDRAALEGADAVIHLAGENIAGGRWTAARKAQLVESRVPVTRFLAETLAGLDRPPAVFVSTSATGFYGSRGDEELTERSAAGSGFLAELSREWEAAAEPAARAGIRVVHPRIGVVLSPAGGALPKMLPAFLAGAGGPIGSGGQWMSWVSIDDVVGLLHHAVMDPAVEGAFNAIAPEPVTNREFGRTLGRVLRRPAVLPVPAAAIGLLFGEMGRATLLASTRALPAAISARGYLFRHPTLELALRHVLGR